MKNTLRHPDYLKLKQRIKSCAKTEQLERLREVVLRFKDIHIEDGKELMCYFLEKEQGLSIDYKNEAEYNNRNNPSRDFEEDSQESLYHQRYEGSKIEDRIHKNTHGFHAKY